MRLRALAVAAAVFAVAGCGSAKPLARDAFTAKANSICGKQQGAVRTIPRPGALVLFAGYLQKALPLVRRQREDVGALRPPAGDSADTKLLLARWDDVLAALRRMNDGAKSGDDARIVFGLRAAARADKAAAPIAARLGLEACRRLDPFTP